LNLIITCPRHFEEEASQEIQKIISVFGDDKSKITITDMPGILTAETVLEPLNIIQKLREKIVDEPWSIRYCLRIIPIEGVCTTGINKITEEILKNIGKITAEDSYRITIEKRNSNVSSAEIISNIAKNIPNKVSLSNPDWIFLVEIIGKQAGVAVIPDNTILSVERVKRSLSD
jgi:tRNA acetyltransferase TAN1